jgi:hypothetical protein
LTEPPTLTLLSTEMEMEGKYSRELGSNPHSTSVFAVTKITRRMWLVERESRGRPTLIQHRTHWTIS